MMIAMDDSEIVPYPPPTTELKTSDILSSVRFEMNGAKVGVWVSGLSLRGVSKPTSRELRLGSVSHQIKKRLEIGGIRYSLVLAISADPVAAAYTYYLVSTPSL